MTSDMLSDIEKRLHGKIIFEVRQIAREIGVHSPTSGKKEDIIENILAIATCKVKPAPKNKRGAPPKSGKYDEALVNDIRACIEYNTLLKEGKGESSEFKISDGTSDKNCQGILVKEQNHFFLRVGSCFPSENDICVHESFVNRFNLKEGDLVEGECRSNASGEQSALTAIAAVNGHEPNSVPRKEFAKLTPIYPKNRIYIANSGNITARMLDLFAPVGCGQRAVISAPANSNKTALIKQIATGISLNEQHFLQVIFVVAGSPEEITDIDRNISNSKVFYTTFDMEQAQHVQAAEFVATYCKNMVECGKDVVLIVDGLSKLEGGAKRLLSSAICAEEGGSLTVIATVSAEGEYSSEYSAELLSVANMRAVLLDSSYPSAAIDISKSYTQYSEYLQSDSELKTAHVLRIRYQTTANIQDILNIFKNTKNNTEIIKSNG